MLQRFVILALACTLALVESSSLFAKDENCPSTRWNAQDDSKDDACQKSNKDDHWICCGPKGRLVLGVS